jgi:hypothetical protein
MSAPREAESLRTREILAPGAVTVNQTADPGLNLLGFLPRPSRKLDGD